MSDAVEPLGGAVGENDDCTFDELDGVELGVGLDDNEALANELEIRLSNGLQSIRVPPIRARYESANQMQPKPNRF